MKRKKKIRDRVGNPLMVGCLEALRNVFEMGLHKKDSVLARDKKNLERIFGDHKKWDFDD